MDVSLEEARSDRQEIRVTNGRTAPADAASDDDDPKMLAVLDLKNRAEELSEIEQSNPHFVFTLTNLPRPRPIGPIAPFSQKTTELLNPIR